MLRNGKDLFSPDPIVKHSFCYYLINCLATKFPDEEDEILHLVQK
jgi:hypothetical protein